MVKIRWWDDGSKEGGLEKIEILDDRRLDRVRSRRAVERRVTIGDQTRPLATQDVRA